jgi:hypothetical protein
MSENRSITFNRIERIHSTSEISPEYEASIDKNHEILLKTVENLSRQLNVVKTKLVSFLSVSLIIIIFQLKLKLDRK